MVVLERGGSERNVGTPEVNMAGKAPKEEFVLDKKPMMY